MQKDTIIYVTDQRQKYLADMLGGEQTDCRNSGGIDYERVGNIVFPTPFSKLKLINSDIEKYVCIEDLNTNCNENQKHITVYII